MDDVPAELAHLFDRRYVAYADADVVGSLAEPPAELVHRVHVVAVTDAGEVIVCASEEGWRFLPGGRLESGEDLDAAIDRELMEEAGAVRTGPSRIFFSEVATYRPATPYKAGTPHPIAWWVFAVVPAKVVGDPVIPDGDAERFTAVHALSPDAAATWLDSGDWSHAGILRLAQHFNLLDGGVDHAVR
jgi:8-oxo-dGTP diphosphatase